MKRLFTSLLYLLFWATLSGQCNGYLAAFDMMDEIGPQRGCYSCGDNVLVLTYLDDPNLSMNWGMMRFSVTDTQGNSILPFSWGTHGQNAYLDSTTGQYLVTMKQLYYLGITQAPWITTQNGIVMGAGYNTTCQYQGNLLVHVSGLSLINNTDTSGCWYDSSFVLPACAPLATPAPVTHIDSTRVADPPLYALRGRLLDVYSLESWRVVSAEGRDIHHHRGPAKVCLPGSGMYVLQFDSGKYVKMGVR